MGVAIDPQATRVVSIVAWKRGSLQPPEAPIRSELFSVERLE